jgi:dolichyl-phosphate-mannose-protein mannosyltransferase
MGEPQCASFGRAGMEARQAMSTSVPVFALTSSQKTVAAGLFALLLSALIYLPSLNNPLHPHWDEYYYIPAVQRHMEGTATYASHPPLGLMLLAAGATLVGDNKAIPAHRLASFSKITDRHIPKGYSFTGIRLASAVAAVARRGLFCTIMLSLGLGPYAAMALTTLYIFENAFVIQFRSVHLDSFQIAFFLAGLLVWLRKREDALSWRDYALFGAFLGLAVSVKTNAAVLLALPAFVIGREIWRDRGALRCWIRNTIKGCAVLGAFAAAVLAVFTLNFALSPHPPDPGTEAGRQDLEYMGPAYVDYLHGRTGPTFAAWRESLTGYATKQRRDFFGVTRNDTNGQAPATWPFYTKPISYRWDSGGEYTAYSTMVGNPVGWRLSFAGILGGIVLVVLRWRKRSGPFAAPELAGDFAKLETIIVTYAVFLAAHTYMGTFRVMYIYHHFIGLILGFVALALALKIAMACVPHLRKNRNAVLGVMSLAVALGFWFYAPFSYHRAITKPDCEMRNILGTQFHCVGK